MTKKPEMRELIKKIESRHLTVAIVMALLAVVFIDTFRIGQPFEETLPAMIIGAILTTASFWFGGRLIYGALYLQAMFTPPHTPNGVMPSGYENLQWGLDNLKPKATIIVLLILGSSYLSQNLLWGKLGLFALLIPLVCQSLGAAYYVYLMIVQLREAPKE